MYKALIQSNMPVDSHKKLWKMKMPLKTKIFAWYVRRGVILTKDNLVKRNWHGSTKCVFFYMMRLLNIFSSIARLHDLFGLP